MYFHMEQINPKVTFLEDYFTGDCNYVWLKSIEY